MEYHAEGRKNMGGKWGKEEELWDDRQTWRGSVVRWRAHTQK
jgi:hypothetical protein